MNEHALILSKAVWLRNAAVPPALLLGLTPRHIDPNTGLALIDLGIDPSGLLVCDPGTCAEIDLAGHIVLPGLIDSHVHLDKAYSVRRTGVPAGGLMDAVRLAWHDSTQWSEADLEARMTQALHRAYVHGTVAMRSHLDSPNLPSQSASWRVMARLQQAWAGRIALQPVALMSIERAEHADYPQRVAEVAERGGILGCFIPDHSATPARLACVFTQAAQHGLDVDFHVDETMDGTVRGLELICDAILAHDFKGRVVAGHCCALSAMDTATRDRIIAKVVQAGVHIIALPHSNLFLQDRALNHSPRLRGLTQARKLKHAGASVHFASDNVQDPFYPYGDYDLIEIFQTAVRLGHLETEILDWLTGQFLAARAACGFTDHGLLALGRPADLVILAARDGFDLMTPALTSDRIVYRAGRALPAPSAHLSQIFAMELQ